MVVELEIFGTIRDAALKCWSQRVALGRALLLPGICLTILNLVSDRIDEAELSLLALVGAGSAAIYAIFAVVCHRVILLGPESLPNRWGLFLTEREGRFLIWVVLIALCAGAATVPAAIPIAIPMVILELEGLVADVAIWLATLPGFYLLARWSVLLPSIAIDDRFGMKEAWSLTRGNGWRLTIALEIPIWVLWGAAQMLFLLPIEGFLWPFLVVLGWMMLGAAEVATLSVAFQRLRGARPDALDD